MATSDRRHFIIKHDIDSLNKLPNFVWRTNRGPKSIPHRFAQVREGDRWVAFAYTDDANERPLSLVTGFYECTRKASFRHVPKGLPVSEYGWKRKGYAWMIEGRRCWKRPVHPVGVPPINELLRPKRVWNNQAIVPITVEDFERIRQHTLSHEFDTGEIPLLRRQPHNEQELLAAVIFGHKKLGIEKIVQVQKAFPDLLVKIDGHSQEVYLELEVYSRSFILHGHSDHVRNRRFEDDDTPVAILCWIDDDPKAKRYVHRVYELQSLIREGKKIRW
jgi:hypothetical protein